MCNFVHAFLNFPEYPLSGISICIHVCWVWDDQNPVIKLPLTLSHIGSFGSRVPILGRVQTTRGSTAAVSLAVIIMFGNTYWYMAGPGVLFSGKSHDFLMKENRNLCESKDKGSILD